jgi:hypothetical protein
MSQTTQNKVGASEHAQGHAEPLTLAQARRGLIEAAKRGMIDGTELTESWFLSLRQEVRNIVRKSSPKQSGKESKGKEKPAKTEAQKPEKKIPAAVTGLRKYLLIQEDVVITEEERKEILSLRTVEEARKMLSGEAGDTFRDVMTKAGRLTKDGKANPGDGSYLTKFGLDEAELKSSRTWDPHFFKVRDQVSRKRSEGGDQLNGAAGSAGSSKS